jgi:hypothetical protein
MRQPPLYNTGAPRSFIEMSQVFTGFMAPITHFANAGTAGTLTANTAYFNVCRAPIDGVLGSALVFIGGTSSGNIDVGLYTYSGGTWTRAWSTGSIACPAASAIANVGNPAVTVRAGDMYAWALAPDNALATFPRVNGPTGAGSLPAGTSPNSADRLMFTKAASFPLPATATDASVSTGLVLLGIGGKIT